MFPIFAPHATDFYKTGHVRMYPDGTRTICSNLTARGASHAPVPPDFDGRVVFFGLQAACRWMLRDLWRDSFFSQPRDAVLARYRRRMDQALGPGLVPVDHLAALHDVGHLPLELKAVPEGTLVDLRVPMLTVRNTDGRFAWLTNYVESQLSAELWKPITVATVAREFRRLADAAASRTGCDPALVPWQGHDFSFRGMSGLHDATITGAAHLTSFLGTDSISALDFLEDHYADANGVADDPPDDPPDDPLGGSVPATEHSVMCAGGEENELDTFRRLLALYPRGILSVVSDTWDFWRVVTEYASALRPEILSRHAAAARENLPGRLVFRPDSGDPVRIVVGDPDAPPGSPARRGAVACLWDTFGGTETATGHRLLHPAVGLIYGDSIDLTRADAILRGLEANNFASLNVVFGIGSHAYQRVHRDSFDMAIKATWAEIDGAGRDLFKAPRTDDGTKHSARGLLRVEREQGRLVLHDRQDRPDAEGGLLEPVFRDGRLLRHQSLREVRARIRA